MLSSYLKSKSDFFSILGILFLATGLLWNACLHGGDFKVFYLAGERFLQQIPIYQYSDGWSPFKYHPSWALFFSLWSMLPLTVSILLFNILNLVFWADGARTWAKVLHYEQTPTSIFFLLLLCVNALSAETHYGQLNGFLFWGATQVFSWMEDDEPKPLRSGILLAVLISLKLNLGILVFYCLNRNWRSSFGMIIGGLGLHLMSALMFKDFLNIELYRSWLNLLLTQSSEQINTFEVQGILRACYVLFGNAMAKTVWAFLMLTSVFFGMYLDRSYFRSEIKTGKRLGLSGCYWLAVVFFFSPLAWWYQILFLFPLAFLLLKESGQKRQQFIVWGCILVFAFVGFNTLGRNGIYVFKSYLGYFSCGFALLAIFLVSALKSKAATGTAFPEKELNVFQSPGPSSRSA